MGFATRVAFGLVLASTAMSARADLVAYDGFRDPTGPLLGQGGGTGFGDPWRAGGFNAGVHDDGVKGGSLGFGGLATSGNSVATGVQAVINGISRDLAAPVAGTPGTTEYASILLRPEGTVGQGIFGGFFGLVLTGTNPFGDEVFFGKPGTSDHYVVETRGGPGRVASGVAAVVDQAALLVVRIDFGAGPSRLDRFTLYVDPTPGAAEPIGSGVTKEDLSLGGIRSLTLYSSGAFGADEIRVGSTFAEVTPVPEPSSAAMVACGAALALVARSWRRRAVDARPRG